MTFLIILAVSMVSISTLFWLSVGLGRYFSTNTKPSWPPSGTYGIGRKRVAILIAAHNEANIIKHTIRSAAQQVPTKNIYVVSDGSTDNTVSIARHTGAHVRNLRTNGGKARALLLGISYFKLCDTYKAVLLLDADTVLSENYLQTALPHFRERDVVAVAGHAKTSLTFSTNRLVGRILVAYRERLYAIAQWAVKYGQAVKWANAIYIVPGFASVYRTTALKDININPGGLVIEDFNMTFEVHAKKLGRIVFQPNHAVAYTQDPELPTDYLRQIHRWSSGFWQTLARHKAGWSVFWVSLLTHSIETIFSSILLLTILASTVVLTGLAVIYPGFALMTIDNVSIEPNIALATLLLIGAIIPDYIVTIIAAIGLRRPSFLLHGLSFFVLRIIDAAICVMVVIETLGKTKSTGAWQSPTRRVEKSA